MDDGVIEGASNIDDGVVEGVSDTDGEVTEGANATDDGAVEGANDEAMVADPKLLTDKMAELMVLVELEGMGSKRPVLISPAMAERNDNST